MKIAKPILVLAAFGLTALGTLLFLVRQQALGDARMMANAVTAEVDGHSSDIASLLGTMSTNDTSVIEDAIYTTLQRPPSTSLIRRADIRVTRTGNGLLECAIDTSRYGVPSRSIRQPRQTSFLSPNPWSQPVYPPRFLAGGTALSRRSSLRDPDVVYRELFYIAVAARLSSLGHIYGSSR